jgi:hypothetical protein
MKVVDLANAIYLEIGSPTDTSIPAIAFWLRGKIGWMNTTLYEDFFLDSALEIHNASRNNNEMSIEAASVLLQYYKVYDIELQIRKMMNALAMDGVLEVQDNLGGTSFKRVNRNEVAKTLVLIRKDEMQLLKDVINSYRSLTSQPSQVAGDDTMSGFSEPYPAYRPMWTRVSTYGKW